MENGLPFPGFSYEILSELVENLCKKAPKAFNGVKVKYARCKARHLDAVVADIGEREVFYDINGEFCL